MKIAIIESDDEFRQALSEKLSSWDVDYFEDSASFGRVSLKPYDCIIVDYRLPSMEGCALINSIAKKTNASLALMSSLADRVSKDIIDNPRVDTFLDRDEIYKKWENSDDLVGDWLRYVKAKRKIVRRVQDDKRNFSL